MFEEPPSPPLIGLPAGWIHGMWREASADAPYEWWDELDPSRFPIRCVRRYRDGRLERFGYEHPDWRDLMPVGEMPSLDEVNADPQFSMREIGRDEFEAIWLAAPDAGR